MSFEVHVDKKKEKKKRCASVRAMWFKRWNIKWWNFYVFWVCVGSAIDFNGLRFIFHSNWAEEREFFFSIKTLIDVLSIYERKKSHIVFLKVPYSVFEIFVIPLLEIIFLVADWISALALSDFVLKILANLRFMSLMIKSLTKKSITL